MREQPTKRWHVYWGRDLSMDVRVWLLGLYWRPYSNLRIGYLRYQRYVEFRLNTSNPFSLRHSLK